MDKIKVIHVVEDYSLKSGGLRTAVKGIIENVKIFNHEIVTFNKEYGDDAYVFYGVGPWKFSTTLRKFLNQQNFPPKTVFHIHGIWHYAHYIAVKICNKRNIPYVITLHGMLEPFHLRKKRFIKSIYLKVIGKNLISKANVVHTITLIEQRNLIKFTGKSSRVFLIPNSIFFDSKSPNQTSVNDEKYIVFIGRIAKQKGIDLILKSMGRLKDNSIMLKIIGPVNSKDRAYYKDLLKLREKLGLSQQVEFLGMKTGLEKNELIQKAHFLLTPSRSEAIGLVNLEAAKLQIPVVASIESGLNLDWSKNGGFLIDPESDESLDNAIKSFWSKGLEERYENGKKLFDFAKENYSWEKNAYNWEKLYKSCFEIL